MSKSVFFLPHPIANQAKTTAIGFWRQGALAQLEEQIGTLPGDASTSDPWLPWGVSPATLPAFSSPLLTPLKGGG